MTDDVLTNEGENIPETKEINSILDGHEFFVPVENEMNWEEIYKKADKFKEENPTRWSCLLSELEGKPYVLEKTSGPNPTDTYLDIVLNVPYRFNFPEGMTVETFNKFKEEIEQLGDNSDLMKEINNYIVSKLRDTFSEYSLPNLIDGLTSILGGQHVRS